MCRAGVDVADQGPLHDPPGVHHRDLVRDVRDDSQVVGDQDQPHLALALEIREQFHDLGLDCDVEGGSGLVGDQHVWIQ